MTLPPYHGYTPGARHDASPRETRRPWLWGIVGAIIGAGVTALAGVVLVVGVLIFAANEFMGEYTVLDGEVTDATEGPCDRLDAAASSLPRFGGPADGVAALHEVTEAIDDILAAIDATGTTDEASLAWRRDLQDLSERVRDYAAELSAGQTPPPDLGARDGLLERLELGSPPDCAPPAALAGLDPDYVNAWRR